MPDLPVATILEAAALGLICGMVVRWADRLPTGLGIQGAVIGLAVYGLLTVVHWLGQTGWRALAANAGLGGLGYLLAWAIERAFGWRPPPRPPRVPANWGGWMDEDVHRWLNRRLRRGQ
jgi:hypothetical protein